jgi:hypothetical protein
MKRTFLLVMLVLVFLTLNTPTGLPDPSGLARARAQAGDSPAAPLAAGYDLTWYTIDAGGGTNNNGGYALAGTIGQPDSGNALSSAGYTLRGGFWFGAVMEQRIYLPLVLKSG